MKYNGTVTVFFSTFKTCLTLTQLARNDTCFDIKSTHMGMVALVFHTLNTAAIAAELHKRFVDVPEFFDHDAVTIDLTAAITSDTRFDDIDWVQWVAMLSAFSMVPLAVRGVPESWKKNLGEHRLVWLAPALTPAKTTSNSTPHAQGDQAPVIHAAPPDTLLSSAMVVDKPLRSGQRVYAKGRDLVMLAMVNPGAEVIADGHIHVYAPLRGRAVAGARGDVLSRIFALNFEPELVSIAGIYQSIDSNLHAGIKGVAAYASLQINAQGEHLIYQAISR
jgi:septum site-determining protein MinC